MATKKGRWKADAEAIYEMWERKEELEKAIETLQGESNAELNAIVTKLKTDAGVPKDVNVSLKGRWFEEVEE